MRSLKYENATNRHHHEYPSKMSHIINQISLGNISILFALLKKLYFMKEFP